LAWLLILLSVVSVAHGNNRKPENRFLIIVETSHAAGKRSKGIAATVESLLNSGIQGRLNRTIPSASGLITTP
jgi:hypothetical protein